MIPAAKTHCEVIGDWQIESLSSSISSAPEIDAFEDYISHKQSVNPPANQQSTSQTATQSFKCPEMPFLRNHLTLFHRPSSIKISINSINALKGCLWDETEHTIDQAIKVTAADLWHGKSHDVDVKVLDTKFDWTYTTYYAGDINYQSNSQSIDQASAPIDQLIEQSVNQSNQSTDLQILPDPQPIPLALLQRPDPILYFTSFPLFEDELHDNGHSTCSIKCRFMKNCFLILVTFFLRVDGVLLRCVETRFYHEMGSDTVTRERTIREESWQSLIKRGKPSKPSDYTDPTTFASRLPIIQQGRQKIKLVTRVTSQSHSDAAVQ